LLFQPGGLWGQTLEPLTVRAVSEEGVVDAATVRAGASVALTNQSGEAVITLPVGAVELTVSKIGFADAVVEVAVTAGAENVVVVEMVEQAEEIDAIVVTSTRTERRIEDVPVRVEVLAQEEVQEKLLMTPGDIAMMLNETSGLRVQNTSPSLGGANLRIQGLRGRYTQILSDGLPLYGGQTGSLSMLQIPPMDLAQVEVIKGAASALYGSSALGGVVNLNTRQPAY
jgi:iron complex outermembrane receptor protein